MTTMTEPITIIAARDLQVGMIRVLMSHGDVIRRLEVTGKTRCRGLGTVRFSYRDGSMSPAIFEEQQVAVQAEGYEF